jgi:cytochrome c peroxidase
VGLYNLDEAGSYPADATGLAAISLKAEDMGKYRTPSLRNVAVTGPYFHDGSVSSLNEAIRVHLAGGRHVTQGPRKGDGRTSPLRSPLLSPRTLSTREVWALEAFLRSLTDDAFLTSPALSNPWL